MSEWFRELFIIYLWGQCHPTCCPLGSTGVHDNPGLRMNPGIGTLGWRKENTGSGSECAWENFRMAFPWVLYSHDNQEPCSSDYLSDCVAVLSSLIFPWNQKPPVLSAIIAHSKCPPPRPPHTHTLDFPFQPVIFWALHALKKIENYLTKLRKWAPDLIFENVQLDNSVPEITSFSSPNPQLQRMNKGSFAFSWGKINWMGFAGLKDLIWLLKSSYQAASL